MTQYQNTPEVRQAIIDGCRGMNASGINQGTSGNISVRVPGGMLITPSGVPYDRMTPEMIVLLPVDPDTPLPDSGPKPSSEWRFHRAILRNQPGTQAVVHAHPGYASALAIQNRPIPACHYMVAAFGGDDVPVAPYALFGSEELAANVVAALDRRTGCLMANHGATTTGESLEKALWRMVELETLARVYMLSEAGGTPHILSASQIEEVLIAFEDYGPTDPT